MITTLSAMRMSRIKSLIIGVLVCLVIPWLGGCGAVRLAYANGPALVWWEVDSYFDFNQDQAPVVKRAIDGFFDWHRNTQLPDYVAFLASAQTQIQEPTTPAAACRWQSQFMERLEPSINKLLTQSAELVPGLGEAQFKHLERRYAKTIDEMKKEFLQSDPVQRQARSIKRARERAEMLYGNLEAAQLRVIKDGVAASPFNPEAWLTERQRRQRDVVQTLRQLVAERADADRRLAALRVLMARAERSSDPEYRAYQIKLTDYNCALAAQIHNATTPAQKKKARDTLKGWEEDLRAVMAAPVPGS
jgi:Family of unknown function (DUF6279)